MNQDSIRQDINDTQYLSNYLDNRIILVSGATDGIGKVLSLACAKYGAQLFLLGRNQQRLDDLQNELAEISDSSHHIHVIDLATAGEADYIQLANKLANLEIPINSVVLNAGEVEILQGLRNFHLDNWLRAITVNQHSNFLLLKCCIPVLELADDPTIVFSTHDCSKAYWGAYGVAKHAQLGMLKILADELDGDKPIRVNGVDPAPVRTKLRTAHFPGVNPKSYAEPEDVVAPYLYFIGPGSKGVTGVNYKINPEFCG